MTLEIQGLSVRGFVTHTAWLSVCVATQRDVLAHDKAVSAGGDSQLLAAEAGLVAKVRATARTTAATDALEGVLDMNAPLPNRPRHGRNILAGD